jgi:hypothetical protein
MNKMIMKRKIAAGIPCLETIIITPGIHMGSTILHRCMKICSSLAATIVLSLTGLGRMIKVSLTSMSTDVKSEIKVAESMKKNIEK